MTTCDICGERAKFIVEVRPIEHSEGKGIPTCAKHLIQACDRSHLLALDIIAKFEVKEPGKGYQGAISMKALTGKK